MSITTPIFGLPEDKIVFTTTDGVGLKKGDEYWYVIGPRVYCIKICSGHDFPKGRRQFSTEELAEEYFNAEEE